MKPSCPVMQSLTSPNWHLPGEFQALLGLALALHRADRSGGERIRDQVDAAIGQRKIRSPASCAASKARRRRPTAHRQVLRPVGDVDCQNEVDARLKAVEPVLFDQIAGRACRSETLPGSRRSTSPGCCPATHRRGTIRRCSMLQAEVHHPTDDEAKKIEVGEHRPASVSTESTSMVARRSGSVISGRSISARSSRTRAAATPTRIPAGPPPRSGAAATVRHQPAADSRRPTSTARSLWSRVV